MAYTDTDKAEMYKSISEDLADIVMKLQDFIDADADANTADAEQSEEIAFAQSASNQLLGYIGNFSVRRKRCESPD